MTAILFYIIAICYSGPWTDPQPPSRHNQVCGRQGNIYIDCAKRAPHQGE